MDDIKDRIAALRSASGMTQDQFGEICGVGKGAVSQWEKGTTRPSLDNLMALRGRLAFSIDWILTGDGNGPSGDQRAKRLVDLYLSLDDRGKDAVFRVAEAEQSYTLKAEELQKKSA